MAASASLDSGGHFQSFLSEEGAEADWEFDKFDDGSHKVGLLGLGAPSAHIVLLLLQ